jgi:hypothetical protein
MPRDPVWIDYEDSFAAAYRRFAEAEFGRDCYQAEPGYIDWLYKENPDSQGYRDFSIGVAGGEVIGCIHKMYLPWTIGGEHVRVPSLHNLMMAEDYRSGGGFWLLKRSLNREQHAVIPSSLPPLSIVYRQMKCQRVPARWFRRIVRPIAGGMRMAMNRLRRAPNAEVRRLTGNMTIAGCAITTQPDPGQLGRLAEALRRSQGIDHVNWNEETVRWRFFHPLGPLHGFAELGSPGRFALLSLGPRDGLAAGRLIFLSDASSTAEGVEKASRILAAAGAHVALAMTARDDLSAALTASGFQQYPFEQETYFYHRQQQFMQHTLAGSEIMDVGFEALPRPRPGSASRPQDSFAAANSLS